MCTLLECADVFYKLLIISFLYLFFLLYLFVRGTLVVNKANYRLLEVGD